MQSLLGAKCTGGVCATHHSRHFQAKHVRLMYDVLNMLGDAFSQTVHTVAAVPVAKRAQTLVMPGTLPALESTGGMLASAAAALSASDATGTQTHSTEDSNLMLASSSDSVSTIHPAGSHSSSSGGSSGGHLTAASFETAARGQVASDETVRMGKMLKTQPRSGTSHHHASGGQ